MLPLSPFPSVFVGDGIADEDPAEWLRQVRLYSLGRPEEDQIKVFQLCLALGSPAEAWYNHLGSRGRTSFKEIVHEFKKVYPAIPYMPLPPWLPLERLEQCALRDEDVGRDVVEEGTGLLLPSHIAYARRIRRLAAVVDEPEGPLVSDARSRLPAAVRARVSKRANTWESYVDAVMNISSHEIENAMESGDPNPGWQNDPHMAPHPAQHMPSSRTKYSAQYTRSHSHSVSSDLPPPPHVSFHSQNDPAASMPSQSIPVHITSPTERSFPPSANYSPMRANGSRGAPYVGVSPYPRDTPSAPPSTHPTSRSWLQTNNDRSPNGSGSGSGSNGHGNYRRGG